MRPLLFHRIGNFFRLVSIVGLRNAVSFALSTREVQVCRRLCGETFRIRGRSSDFATLRQVFIDRHYDFPGLVATPATVVDLGANIGLSVIFFRHRFPKAAIFAFEPEASNFRLLTSNCRHLSGVHVKRIAVSDADQSLRLVDHDAATDSYRFSDKGYGDVVEGWSIATLMSNLELDRIDVLKMDVEGMEYRIFSGNLAWIDRVSQILVEPHDHIHPGCADLIRTVASRKGFRVNVFGEGLVLTKTDTEVMADHSHS